MTSALLNTVRPINIRFHSVAFLFKALCFLLGLAATTFPTLVFFGVLFFLELNSFIQDSFLKHCNQSWNSEIGGWSIIITTLFFSGGTRKLHKIKKDGCKILVS